MTNQSNETSTGLVTKLNKENTNSYEKLQGIQSRTLCALSLPVD